MVEFEALVKNLVKGVDIIVTYCFQNSRVHILSRFYMLDLTTNENCKLVDVVA